MEVTRSEIPEKIVELAEFVQIPFHFEANSDYLNWFRWFRENWASSVVYVAIYLVALAMLKKWMKNREPFDLRKLLVLWNLGLAIFSVAGTVRILPELVRLLRQDGGFHRSVCEAR